MRLKLIAFAAIIFKWVWELLSSILHDAISMSPRAIENLGWKSEIVGEEKYWVQNEDLDRAAFGGIGSLDLILVSWAQPKANENLLRCY